LTGFLSRADLASLARRGRLADGTAWPVPVTLEAPDEVGGGPRPGNPLRRVLVLTDPEGAPVAAVDALDVWPTRPGGTASAARPPDRRTAGMARSSVTAHTGGGRAQLPPAGCSGHRRPPLHRPQVGTDRAGRPYLQGTWWC